VEENQGLKYDLILIFIPDTGIAHTAYMTETIPILLIWWAEMGNKCLWYSDSDNKNLWPILMLLLRFQNMK